MFCCLLQWITHSIIIVNQSILYVGVCHYKFVVVQLPILKVWIMCVHVCVSV